MRCGKIFVVTRYDDGLPYQHRVFPIVNRPQFVEGCFSAVKDESDEGVNISETFARHI